MGSCSGSNRLECSLPTDLGSGVAGPHGLYQRGNREKGRRPHHLKERNTRLRSIYEMKEALRGKLLIVDAAKRPEMLIRLTLLFGASGNFRGTADDFTRVMQELCGEFGISDEELDEAMNQSELLGEAWRETRDAPKAWH